MLKGKTKSGFKFAIDKDVLDDWELLELLEKIDSGDMSVMPKAITFLLGNRQYENLKKFIKKRDGKIKITTMVEEFNQIMTAQKETKN